MTMTFRGLADYSTAQSTKQVTGGRRNAPSITASHVTSIFSSNHRFGTLQMVVRSALKLFNAKEGV